MSWFDEAVARRQHERRTTESATTKDSLLDPLERQRQEVEAFDPLVQRLLHEYGDHVLGKSLLQRRFLVRLERPGKSGEKSWNWHWHLDSLVKHMPGVEVHPTFAPSGTLHGFVLLSGTKRIELTGIDEAVLKDGLVSLYLQ